MIEFNPFEGFNEAGGSLPEDSAISMVDEDGMEIGYHMLASKKDGDCLYLLVEEEMPDEAVLEGAEQGEPVAEVLIFKCVAESESDDMVFELIDEAHESFELALDLFKEDFDALGIEY